MLYKIFLKYPDALRPAFPRLKEKLEDPDPGVQSAAGNIKRHHLHCRHHHLMYTLINSHQYL
jgi:hypothetical protein